MKIILLSCIYLIAFAMPLKAQYYYEHRYGVDNGLLSLEVEQVYCTKTGDIWVTYSVLPFVSIFDGLHWTHVDLVKLQLPQQIMLLNESEDGLWFNSSTDHLIFILFDKNEKWHQFTFDRSFKYAMNTETNSPVILGPDYIPYNFNSSKKQFEKQSTSIYKPTSQDDFEQLLFFRTNQSLILQFLEPEKKESRIQYGPKLSKSKVFKNQVHLAIFEVADSIWFLTLKNESIGILKNEKYIPFTFNAPKESPVIPIRGLWRIDQENKSSLEKEYYFYCKSTYDDQSHIYKTDIYGNTKIVLKNAPSDIGRVITFDQFGRLWITTSSGISRIDNSQLCFQENNPEMVRGLHTLGEDSNGKIWMGGYTGTFAFSTFDGEYLKSHAFKKSNNFISVLPGTYRDVSGNLYNFGETGIGLFGIKDEKIIPVNAKGRKEKLYGYIFQPLKNGFVGLGLNDEGLAIARLNNFYIDSLRIIGPDKGLRLLNVIAIAQDRNDRIWMGRTSQGIAVYEPRSDTVYNWMREDNPDNGLGAVCLNIDENNTLWMGTQKGLYFIRDIHEFQVTDNLFDWAKELFLPGDPLCRATFLHNDEKYIIVGTELAVHFIEKASKSERPRIFSLRFGKDLTGSGCEQNAVLKDSKGYLWVGAQTGAIRLDLNNLPFDTSASELSLKYFRAGGIDIAFANNKVSDIPPKIRNLEISIQASGNPMLHDNLVFDIILLRSKGDTLFSKVNTTELTFELEYLPSDKYDLQVIAYKNNVESSRVTYAFIIPALLTEKPWFWIILAILIMALPVIWFSASFKHKKSILQQEIRLEQSRRERDELKILALANFFNPHFINNSLHWIQSKYRKDPDTALIIQRLAENVNILFHNSNKGKAYHALGNEIELVKNYLGIQQIRFNQEFNVSIETPKDSDSWQQVNIPSMLLQIHTENAIEKGIRQRRAANCFKLIITDHPNHLEIYLEDDGIGRKNGEQEKVVLARKGSTTIMQDLIDVLNQYNSEKILIQFRDNIFSDEHNKYGTGIQIILPKNFHYDIS